MKTSYTILLLCILPLILMGINTIKLSESPELTQNMLLPTGDFCSNLQDSGLIFPNISADRDRNWRLTEILHQSDYDENNLFQIYGQEVIYYNAINPDQVDSLVYCNYDSTAFTYVPFKTRKYYYAPNGVDVVRIDLHYATAPADEYYKTIFEYDSQHSLIHQYKYNWDSVNSVHRITNRYHWTITDGAIADRAIVYFDDNGQANYYTRVAFNRDLQGRNIGYLMTSSPDSLNWTNSIDCVTNYHTGDTSTGLDQIHYFAHDYVLDLYNSMGSYYFFSMISDYTTRTWSGSGWTNNFRAEYGYNNYYQLTTTTQYNYNTDWHETNMYTCNYDINSNLSQYSLQTWNAVNSNWNGYQQIHNLSWGEYTAVDDEIAPRAEISLSTYPNPFRNVITINLNTKANAPYDANINNIKGQLIRQFDKQRSKTLVWDGKDNADNTVGNGVYLIKMSQNGQCITQKIIRIK